VNLEALSIAMRQGYLFQGSDKGAGHMQIHLIENADNFTKLRDKVWESGWWVLTEDEAKKLVGGQIYFHRKKSEPSFYGGSIRSFRIEQEDPHRGSIIFEFEYRETCRGIKADKCGWSLEKKIV
jgi:hypothetical protein